MFSQIKKLLKIGQTDLSTTNNLWELFQKGQYDEAIEGAKPYLNHKTKFLAKDASKLIGQCLFRQKQYDEALQYFQKATLYDVTVNDFFNVASAATLSHKIKIGREAFNQAINLQIEKEGKEQPSVPYLHLYYAYALKDVGEYQLSFEQIEILRNIYEQLKITDLTFLHIRGVPPLSHTMEIAIDVLSKLNSEVNVTKWIDDLSKKIDQDGQEYLSKIKQQTTNH